MTIPGMTTIYNFFCWYSNQPKGTKVTLTSLGGGDTLVAVEGSYEARKRSRFDEPNGGRSQSEASATVRPLSTPASGQTQEPPRTCSGTLACATFCTCG